MAMAGSGAFAEIIDGDVFKYYADGVWKKSSSGKSVSIINPTTRKTQYKVQGKNYHDLYVFQHSSFNDLKLCEFNVRFFENLDLL